MALAAKQGPELFEVWSLRISLDGNSIYLMDSIKGQLLLQASVTLVAEESYLVTLNYSPEGSSLHIGTQLAASGLPVPPIPTNKAKLIIGSSADGASSAEGELEELFCFSHPLSSQAISEYFAKAAPKVSMGPMTKAEADAQLLAAAAMNGAFEQATVSSLSQEPSSPQALGFSCSASLAISRSPNSVVITITIQNGVAGQTYELYRTLELAGTPINDSEWRKLGEGQNGSTFTIDNAPRLHSITNSRCRQSFYILACKEGY